MLYLKETRGLISYCARSSSRDSLSGAGVHACVQGVVVAGGVARVYDWVLGGGPCVSVFPADMSDYNLYVSDVFFLPKKKASPRKELHVY